MSDSDSRPRLAHWAPVLLVVAAVLAAWSVVLAITGGILYDLGPLRLSSRNPTRPMLLASVLALLAWRAAYRARLEESLARLAAIARIVAPALAGAAAVVVLALGWAYGVRAAGGSDPLGYVSAGALFGQGQLKIDQSFASALPWPNAPDTIAPLGYRAASNAPVMVPTYAPGLPALMAAARVISLCAPYFVAPMCGALLVFLTYCLGRRFFNPVTGLVGAVLTASSPTVVFMSMWPMADVPAASFWIAALVAAAPSTARRAALAGVLTGVAVAIRPNLVPLAVFPWLLTMPRDASLRTAIVRTTAFGAGLAPLVGFVAWTNSYLYGSPLMSGYGSLSPGFALEHAADNLARYPSWWLQSQGWLAFLFVPGLVRSVVSRQRERLVLAAFPVAVLLSYVFYIPFDAWWFLRFLLPAIPLAFLFCADVVHWATSRLSRTGRGAALACLLLVSLTHTMSFSRSSAILGIGEGEQKYADAAAFVDRVTPREAVVIALQHSGSARYYAGRLTVRFDALGAAWLDRAVDALERNGRPVYLLLEDHEVQSFRDRFAGQRSLAVLDRGPAATGRGGQLRFYAVNGAPFDSPALIPRTSRAECLDVSPGFFTAGTVVSGVR